MDSPVIGFVAWFQGFARVEALDPLASKFADAKDKAAVIAEAKAAVAKLEGDAKASGELYVKFMEKAVEKVGGGKASREAVVKGWSRVCGAGSTGSC